MVCLGNFRMCNVRTIFGALQFLQNIFVLATYVPFINYQLSWGLPVSSGDFCVHDKHTMLTEKSGACLNH